MVSLGTLILATPPRAARRPLVTPLVIFTATRWEFHAVRSALPSWRTADADAVTADVAGTAAAVTLVRCGIGPERARASAERALRDRPVGLAVSSGYAAALGPAAIGDLVIGTTVRAVGDEPGTPDSATYSCSVESTDALRRAADAVGVAVHQGPFVSVSRVLCRAAEKTALGRATGAIAVDMESAALAAVASRYGVPFVAVRTVSDLADEELPVDFNDFLTPKTWARGVMQCLAHPAALGGLARLRAQAAVASRHLSAVCARWLPEAG
jgi:adenosylhomocysteine nucleosidase